MAPAVSDLDSFRRRFRYHAWATSTLAASVHGVHAALRPLGHALLADRVWLLRLRGEPTGGVALWPDLDGAACRALARRNAGAYAALLDGVADLDGVASYRTSGGAAYETPVRDVLDHVLLHGAHHRGQANAALRAAGVEPPWVDLVRWVRLGEPALDGG